MKSKQIICSTLIITALLGTGLNRALAADDAKLLAKAKITKEQAEKTALEKVPGGTIKEGELEEEKGKLIWSFDISKEGTKNITEVNVDAMTGAVIAVDVETPKDEAKEAKEEAKEKKGKKAEKDDDDDKKEEKK
ncbi:PepSY domain-containing protein [Pedosphaera parvula]|uniref:Propeptide PepSY amd peptidase M4 n=1 Tax=Pedosphaera parvula (strain Ellin514) TaxID=320771 RepID=B9XE92_PEDPL|nr:PepSY domain-containing protein [Pedosphaera parvula]EEF61983.1 Propeptide PepSY amd peptidase M4 [Pedosphaera parvula Ellin514]